jgi:hypothetical protein
MKKEKIYRLMNHDSLNCEPAKFEAFTLEEYSNQFGVHYPSISDAVDADSEYLFTEEQMNEFVD